MAHVGSVRAPDRAFGIGLHLDQSVRDLEHQVRLWDATGWTHIGIATTGKYPNSHDTIAFGVPTLHVLADGDLYASRWCTVASISHNRWARLRTDLI